MSLALAHGAWAAEEKPAALAAAAAETDRGAQLRAKLAKPLTAEFVETPLCDVLDFLGDKVGVQIHAKWKQLEDAGIAKEAVISTKLKDVPGDMLLDLVLDQTGGHLMYTVQRGILVISTKEDLSSKSTTQVYNVRDLLTPAAPAAEAKAEDAPAAVPEQGAFGGIAGDYQTPAEKLVATIRSTVAPDSWAEMGGPGSVVLYNGLLVVKQSPAVQQELADLLRMLREAAAPAAEPAKPKP
jgi:hypothetical protein